MQVHERIRIEPVAARPMAPFDHDDVSVAVLDQRIDERHPERAGADDQIVRLDHARTVAPCDSPIHRFWYMPAESFALDGSGRASDLFRLEYRRSLGRHRGLK